MKRLELITDIGQIVKNAYEIRGRLPSGVKMLCVVKANAYGHGAINVAEALEKAGLSDMFAVATPYEGLELRANGIKTPILVLGLVSDKDDCEISIANGLIQTVDSADDAIILNETAKRLKLKAEVHIKADTGMSRIGVRGESELKELAQRLKTLGNIKVTGLFTHFCAAEEDEEFTEVQRTRFIALKRIMLNEGFRPLCHAAASAAMLNDKCAFDMVRAGIALYGVGNGEIKNAVKPALTLISHPIAIRQISKGETVGYARRFTAYRDSVIATIPCGYADGYPRILGNKSFVLIDGKRAPVVGNVCMDMLMADVTDIPNVSKQSKAVLLGCMGEGEISPCELAELAGTIPYEIMTGFSTRVARSTK